MGFFWGFMFGPRIFWSFVELEALGIFLGFVGRPRDFVGYCWKP